MANLKGLVSIVSQLRMERTSLVNRASEAVEESGIATGFAITITRPARQ